MAEKPDLHLLKETRINLESRYQDNVIAVELSSSSSFARSLRRKRKETAFPLDEKTFTTKYLATTSGMFSRRASYQPKCFYWRIIDGGKSLSIQCVDLTRHSEEAKDPYVILRLNFSHAIRPGCVVFADQADPSSSTFRCFTVTENNELYTVTLKTEYFTKSTTDHDPQKWSKAFSPSCFSGRHPLKLIALDDLDLLCSREDGSLLRLSRSRDSDGSTWTELVLSDNGWGLSLKSLISWQGGTHVKYGNITYDRNAVIALSLAPDKRHVFGITLNNFLKSWNLETGKVGCIADLSGPGEHKDRSNIALDPAQFQNVAVIDSKLRSGDQYYLVTYSPVAGGQFKFWAVVDPDNAEKGLIDLYSDKTLEAPPPAGPELWRIDGFKVTQSPNEKRKLVLYVLWKHLSTYVVKTVTFEITRLKDTWGDWTAVASESLSSVRLPELNTEDLPSFAQTCLNFIFFPGRFPVAVLETALAICRHSLKAPSSPAFDELSLRERIALTVGGDIWLRSKGLDSIDFEKFRNDAYAQWLSFYRIVAELDKKRKDALSLEVDPFSSRVWILLSDGISVLRDCSSSELIYHNQSPTSNFDEENFWDLRKITKSFNPSQFEALSAILNAASLLISSLPGSLVAACQTALNIEIIQPSLLSASSRLRQFYDRSQFTSLLDSEDYNALVEKLDATGVADLVNLETITALAQEADTEDSRQSAITTAFMKKILMRGCQEQIHVQEETYFGLLLLTVFLEVEIDRDEAVTAFDGTALFSWLLGKLKEQEILKWLSQNMRSVPPVESDDLESGLERLDVSPSKSANIPQIPVTLFEELYIGYLSAPYETTRDPGKTKPLGSGILTNCIQQALDGIGLSHVDTFDKEIPLIACHLVRTGNFLLAYDFSRFLPSTPWGTYVKGRVLLVGGETPQAAALFRKAAVGLARKATAKSGKALSASPEASDGLITPNDKNNFFSGYANYYLHILEILESQSAYSYVTDFAKLALQFAGAQSCDEKTKSELLSRLFYASLRTSRYVEAYMTLMQYNDKALQSQAVKRLIYVACEEGSGQALLRFPFTGLEDLVDEALEIKCQSLVNVEVGPAYHKLLYAWRVKKGDIRGAASILHDRLRRLQAASMGGGSTDTFSVAILQGYLALLNLLSTLGPDQDWILASSEHADYNSSMQGSRKKFKASGGSSVGESGKPVNRVLLTLADVRREYEKELDRVASIDSGQFSIFDGPATVDGIF